MSTPEPLSREVLNRARAYVRVDRHAIAALPELGTAIDAFKPVRALPATVPQGG
jgi:hypothetical protein